MTTSTTEPTFNELVDWLWHQTWSQFAQSLADYYGRNRRLSAAQEEAARKMYAKVAARNAQRAARPAPAAPADPAFIPASEPGFYMVDGIVYKVKISKTGNPYAVKRVGNTWEYVGATRYNGITTGDAVTAEVAAAHGAATGICIFCNAELDDKDGLGKIVGVGPTCARRHLGMTQRQLAAHLGREEMMEGVLA